MKKKGAITMFLYDVQQKKLRYSTGGYLNEGLPIRDTYVKLGMRQHGMLYEPVVKNEKSRIGIVMIHSDVDYSTLNACGEMAKRGYIVFGGQVSDQDAVLDEKILDVKRAVELVRNLPGIEKVIIMGHSGGATLMSAYQAVAEGGAKVFQGDDMLIKCAIREDVPAADGMMVIDSNWGNGAMTLFSIDPAVVEEGNGQKLDPALDIFNPANGYDPAGSHYSEAFVKTFCEAQKERNNRIIKLALDRLCLIEQGKGAYTDDEPFVVTGGSQAGPVNKLFPEDTSLFAHTKKAYPVLRADGSANTEIVRSVRPAVPGRRGTVTKRGAAVTTVRHFLSERSVLAGDGYGIHPDGAAGILWDRSYSCTPANIKHVHVPILVMGMTGNYEYLAAEEVYAAVPSEDKTIAFVEGADHNFFPISEKYGDTQKILFDHMDKWLSQPGRFID